MVGGLCRACEVDRFGDGLRDATPGPRCLVCSADPAVALPEHKLELTAVAGETRQAEHYAVESTTPRLCAHHAPAGLAPGDAANSAPVAHGRQR